MKISLVCSDLKNLENVALRLILHSQGKVNFLFSDLCQVLLTKCLLNMVLIAFSFRRVTIEQS